MVIGAANNNGSVNIWIRKLKYFQSSIIEMTNILTQPGHWGMLLQNLCVLHMLLFLFFVCFFYQECSA